MAVDVVERHVSSLQRWVDRHPDDVVSEPLRPYIEALRQVRYRSRLRQHPVPWTLLRTPHWQVLLSAVKLPV
jgi:hypothetical protein